MREWLTQTVIYCLAAPHNEQLHSPQLRQSIASLVNALQTGNYNAVVTNFGLDPTAGAAKLAFGDGTGFPPICFSIAMVVQTAHATSYLCLPNE